VLLLAAAVAAGSGAAHPAPAPTRPAASLEEFAGGSRYDLRFDGRLEALAVTRGGDEGPEIFVLLADAGAEDEAASPRRLVSWSPGAGGGERVREGLPGGFLRAHDLDGDGRDDLLLLSAGELRLLRRGPLGTWPPALGETHRDARLGRPSRLLPAPGGPPWAVVQGALLAWGLDRGGAWHELDLAVDLPVSASLAPDGLAVSTPSLEHVGRAPDRGDVWVGRAITRGPTRLHALVVTRPPDAPPRRTDAWMALPRPEERFEALPLLMDGDPVMVVTSKPAAALKILDEKQLRVFPLRADRTRRGRPPLLAVESRINLWQPVTAWARDVDADGRDDLVLGYYKGLRSATAVLDVYLRQEDGSFRARPGDTEIDIEEGADRTVMLLEDFDADGRPDLLLRTAAGLQLHRGREPGRRGGNLVDESPARTVPLPADLQQGSVVSYAGTEGVWAQHRREPLAMPRALQVDDDDALEVLFAGPAGERHSRLVLVDW
jgi:hypothetical protein